MKTVWRQRAWRGLGLALCAVATTGCVDEVVVRSVDGHPTPGRFIPTVAYAAYAAGVEAEARGDRGRAVEAYRAAAIFDPEAFEPHARLGAVLCAMERVAAAREAFGEAHERRHDDAMLWRERAVCAERRGDLKRALRHAERALHYGAEQRASLLVARRVFNKAGQPQRALALLREGVLREPGALDLWSALHDDARAAGDERWAEEAARRVRELRRRNREPGPTAARWNDVDAALATGDLRGAKRHARRVGASDAALAARALLHARPKLAVGAVATRVEAEPTASAARVALAVSRERAGESGPPAHFEGLADGAPLGAVGQALMAELLARHVSPEAARAWTGTPLKNPQRALEKALQRGAKNP